MEKKTLQQCLIPSESPIVLAARKKLFVWLSEKIKGKPGWKVFHTISVENSNTMRNIDCIVQSSKKTFAYLIIDKSLQAEDQKVLIDEIQKNEWVLHIVFTKTWLHAMEDSPRNIYLSERELKLASRKEFDLTVAGDGRILGSLFYFDCNTDSMIFLRRIRKIGSEKYHCDIFECRLKDVLILPATGEFLAKSEPERLKKIKIIKEVTVHVVKV